MLALGLEGDRVMLMDEAIGEVRWTVQAHEGHSCTDVAMSSDGRIVASVASTEENWKLWDCERGARWMTGARHDGTGACICEVDELGHRLSHEGCPVVAHTAGLHALAFSPCGQWLASGGEDGAVILWDAQTGEAERRMAGGSRTVFALGFSARRRSIRLWDVDSGEIISSFAGGECAAFSQDTIATADDTNDDVLLVNAETGTLRLRLVGHTEFVYGVSFSVGDGSKLASVSRDGICKVWDSSTGALLRTIEVGQMLFSVTLGRDWVRDMQKGVAFAMGHHPRLGERSEVHHLDAGVVRMILDRVWDRV